MSESISRTGKKEKQKKTLRKMVAKFYKKDLEEILVIFFASKKGSKDVLKQRVIEFIDNAKKEIDFNKLRKEIRRVYKSNPKIKKSPKKGKSLPKKSSNKVSTAAEQVNEPWQWNPLIGDSDDDEEDEIPEAEIPSAADNPILRVPNPPIFTFNERPQTLNSTENYESPHIPNTEVMANSTTNRFEFYFPQFVGSGTGQPYSQPSQPSSLNMTLPSTQSQTSDAFNIYRNHNVNQSQGTNAYSMIGGGVRPLAPQFPFPNMATNSVPNNQLIRPQINPFNSTAQPINYSINNYFESCPQNLSFQQNLYQNPMSDVLNPQTFDSLIEQQKFLLSQYPKSFQDNKSSTDSDVPITDFIFKSLPKFKVFKKLKETKIIGSLTDIGTEVHFDIKPTDLEPNYFEERMSDSLRSLLDKKCLKIQLRFTYVSDVNSRQQKDSLPEYLCIEFNNQRIYSDEEDCDKRTGPFDLSDYCGFNQNKAKFYMNKEKYTFLMPCIYEISIVNFETCDSFLNKLKQNMSQFLSSDSTKQLIRSRNEQLSQDEIISLNTDTKLKLICPLSCRRIETPCRTFECKHIECFDGHSFFKTNELRYDWFCPICQKSAQFDKLRIDGYVSEVLTSTKVSVTEIYIKPDASYDVLKKEKSEVIELDDTESDDDIECSVIDADGCIVLD